MLDLPCDFAAVDVVDIIGTNRMNITKNVDKWSVDADGRRALYKGRNKEARSLKHDDHHDLEELHANGVHVTPRVSSPLHFDADASKPAPLRR